MEDLSNIVIADESAAHLYLHVDSLESLGMLRAYDNPLLQCARTSEQLSEFNTCNPLYGGEPVHLLVPDMSLKRRAQDIHARCCSYDLPFESFLKLRTKLFVASPELVFTRMALLLDDTKLVMLGMNLCARYYIRVSDGEVMPRSQYLTTHDKLLAYTNSVRGMKGAAKAQRALKWVLENSGSPEETRMKIQYCHPMRLGGFALPFNAMNYDYVAGRNASLAEQSAYSIDLVNTLLKHGLEYDGSDYHQDTSKDKRRRNALAAFGWQISVIDRTILYNPEATEKAAYQIAKRMGVRIRKPQGWESRYVKLRGELGLPV